VPFLIGILLLGVGMFIRLRIMESPGLRRGQKNQHPTEMPILEVLRRYPRNVLLAMGARFAENAFFYIITAFVLTYATQQARLAKDQVLQAVLIGSAVQFFVIPFFGWLSDRIGRRPVYLGGAFFIVLFAFPFFWLIDLASNRRARAGRHPRPHHSQRHVWPAGGVLLRTVRHPRALQRCLARLSTRLAARRWTRSAHRHRLARSKRRQTVAGGGVSHRHGGDHA
jgi:hypothetical protein